MATTKYPDLKEILVQVNAAGTAVVKLYRPAARNAFTNTMAASLVEAFGRLDEDDAVKVVVLTGEPNAGRAFCAGADLSAGDFSSGSSHAKAVTMNEHRDGGGKVSLSAFRIRKPTICAINGHAVGIGITMTLAFDIRVAWRDAKIGFVFGQRGIVPEAASSYFLPRLIGHSRALELFMTAKVIPASSESLNLLFSSLHPTPEATTVAALELASQIAENNSSLSMALTKAMVWRGTDSPEDQHLLDSKAMHVSGNSEDSKEGVRAFKEKRVPKYPATVPKDLPVEFYPWWAEKDVRLVKSRL